VSTDKVDSEIPSPYDGKLLDILVHAGETVPVGTVLARIGAAGSQVAGSAGNGSGPVAVESPRAVTAPSGAAPVGRDGAGGRLLSPLVRRLAAEHGIDVTTVPGTGVGGRIRREDMEKAIAAGPTTAAAPAAAPAATQPAPRATKAATDGRGEVVPLSRMRLILADTLKASQTLAASVWTSVEVDFDNVERVRTEFKARFKKETGASLSYLPFIARAVCDALRVFPTVNSSIDLESKTMTLHPYVNLGCGGSDEQGLLGRKRRRPRTSVESPAGSPLRRQRHEQRNCPTRRCRVRRSRSRIPDPSPATLRPRSSTSQMSRSCAPTV
jgi:2-oxoglutarate dehydrogenase E2 component (dihydrolipoamide succinyltransferase)